MARTVLTITSDLFDDSSQEASIRENLPVRTLIAEARKEFNLPEGNYSLIMKSSGKMLDPEKTLEQSGVQTGAVLILNRERRAPVREMSSVMEDSRVGSSAARTGRFSEKKKAGTSLRSSGSQRSLADRMPIIRPAPRRSPLTSAHWKARRRFRATMHGSQNKAASSSSRAWPIITRPTSTKAWSGPASAAFSSPTIRSAWASFHSYSASSRVDPAP
jgi:hypothetical protein